MRPKDHRGLADKIEILIKDNAMREQYAHALKQSVEKEFSLEKMVRETLAVY